MIPQKKMCVDYFKHLIFSDFKGVNCWIAGGAVRDFFMKHYTDSDIDMFFPEISDLKTAEILIEKDGGQKIFENDNAIKYRHKGRVVDLIKKYFGSPQETIDNFDFTVCCAAVDRRKVVTHQTLFIDLAARRLVINKLPFPLSTLQRMQKYIKKGFTICNGGILEIAKAISELNMNDPSINVIGFYPDGTPKFVRLD